MRFVPTKLEGAYVVEPERHEDERGFFARTWSGDEFAEHGLVSELSQCSVSRNSKAGTLRGMHFQTAPHEEAKLVRCTAGAIFDVIVDLRPGSATLTDWVGVELAAETGRALYIPKGFAHGFQTLVDGAEVFYMISAPYVPEAASGVRWDDPAFAIDWPPAGSRIINERDRSWPDYRPREFALSGAWRSSSGSRRSRRAQRSISSSDLGWLQEPSGCRRPACLRAHRRFVAVRLRGEDLTAVCSASTTRPLPASGSHCLPASDDVRCSVISVRVKPGATLNALSPCSSSSAASDSVRLFTAAFAQP